MCLSTFSANSAAKLDVFGHDGYSLSVDSAQVSVFEKTYQVCFGSFLKSHDCAALETKVSLEIWSDLTDKSLDRKPYIRIETDRVS